MSTVPGPEEFEVYWRNDWKFKSTLPVDDPMHELSQNLDWHIGEDKRTEVVAMAHMTNQVRLTYLRENNLHHRVVRVRVTTISEVVGGEGS